MSYMDNILDNIDSVKHIVILSDTKNLAVASALYSHLLRLDKKLSFVSKPSHLSLNFSFLPWYDKIKTSQPSSYDLIIEVDFSCIEFYDYLKIKNIKIRKKLI